MLQNGSEQLTPDANGNLINAEFWGSGQYSDTVWVDYPADPGTQTPGAVGESPVIVQFVAENVWTVRR